MQKTTHVKRYTLTEPDFFWSTKKFIKENLIGYIDENGRGTSNQRLVREKTKAMKKEKTAQPKLAKKLTVLTPLTEPVNKRYFASALNVPSLVDEQYCSLRD